MASDLVPVTFGLVVTSGGDAAGSELEALAAWMRERAGVDIEARPSETYAALAEAVREGSCDVAWLPPVVYARIAEGVTPFGSVLREGEASYASAVVVRADSDVRRIADLHGARAGWVDPWSAAGFVVPRIELARAGVDPSAAFRTEHHYGSHRAAMTALAEGECDVAATFARRGEAGVAAEGAWSSVPGLGVRVLASYGPIPPDVLAARRNLDPSTYERTLEALRAAFGDDEARALLRGVFGGDAFREGIDPGHETLRRAVERAIATGLFD